MDDLLYKKEDYQITAYLTELSNDYSDLGSTNLNTVSYFKYKKLAMIGTNLYKSPIDATNPKITVNINGKKTLTFTMYYKYFDYYLWDYAENPLVSQIQNDTLIEVKENDKYYDLIVTKVVKNTNNNVVTYTAEDAHIIELGKNGYNAELAIELENNIGTVNQLGEEILKTSDWEVAPVGNNVQGGASSELIIQSLEESLYELKNVNLASAQFSKLTNYLPDSYYMHNTQDYSNKDLTNATIYAFYNTVKEEDKYEQISFLYCGKKDPIVNADGTIVNSYNYTTDRANLESYLTNKKLSILRGRRVIKQPKIGYDEYLRKTVNYYTKSGENKTYYGYSETSYLSPYFTQNFLSNSHNMTSLYGWVQIYDTDEEQDIKRTARLQIETMPLGVTNPIDPTQKLVGGDCAYVTYLKANGKFLNKGLHGNRTTIKSLLKTDQFVFALLDHTEGYNYNITSNDTSGAVSFKVGFYEYTNLKRNCVNWFKDIEHQTSGFIMETAINNSTTNTFTVIDPYDKNKKKIYKYVIVSPQNDIPDINDITQGYALDYNLGSLFESNDNIKIFDTMFFRYVLDQNGKLVYPTKVPDYTPDPINQYSRAEDLIKTNYFIYEDTFQVDSSTGHSKLVYSGENPSAAGYTQILNESCEKIGTLTGKQSNYYTLLSNLTKQFECWFIPQMLRDEDGNIIYENKFYDSNGNELRFLSSPQSLSNENINCCYFDGNSLKINKKNIRYKWVQKNKSDFDSVTYVRSLAYLEELKPYLDDLSKTYEFEDIKQFGINSIYRVTYPEDSQYPNREDEYYQLQEDISYSIETALPGEVTVIKKPKKVVSFKNYLNETPNWSGFKYGLNINSIERTEDNAKFSTKVIVKNNSNEFATNKFCSIARSPENPARDNFIIDFGYYVRQGFIDREQLNEDLFGENGYYNKIKNLNEANEVLTQQSLDLIIEKDKAQSDWETYYLADQAAQESINKYLKMLANCGDQFQIDLNNWHIGGLWEIRDKTYVLHEVDKIDDMSATTEYVFFNGLVIDQNNREYESPLDGIELPVIYYNGEEFYQVQEVGLNGDDDEEAIAFLPQLFPQTNDIYFYLKDEPVKLKTKRDPNNNLNLKQYQTWNGTFTQKYNNKGEYLFNKAVYRYCQQIDELLLKCQIYSALAASTRTVLDTVDVKLANYNTLTRQKVKEKNAIQQQFLIKYSRFLRESTWSDDKYFDDTLYYLDARDSLHQAAFPQISYNITTIDIDDDDRFNCYKLSIGDYTFVEDTEFFGWDMYGRPAKEWVVVTEIIKDYENPKNNQIRIQNYKTQLEDLFSRISASIQNLELNIGGYNRRIEPVGDLGGCVIESDYIASKNYDATRGTGWALYSDGTIIYKGQELKVDLT